MIDFEGECHYNEYSYLTKPGACIEMKSVYLFVQPFYRLANRAILKLKKVEYDSGLEVNGILGVHGDGKIRIGKNTRFNSSEHSNPIGGMDRMVLSSYYPGIISIGDNVGISNSAIVAYQSVTIGDNVLIGGNTKIYDTDFHSLDASLRGKGRDIEKPVDRPVHIGNNVFIGAHCIILKGVTIGDGSIIGAGSVVTKSVPAGQLWAGNPARFIRELE